MGCRGGSIPCFSRGSCFGSVYHTSSRRANCLNWPATSSERIREGMLDFFTAGPLEFFAALGLRCFRSRTLWPVSVPSPSWSCILRQRNEQIPPDMRQGFHIGFLLAL